MRKVTFPLIIFILLASVMIAVAQDTSDGVSVTVYNQGTALIQDRRTFTFETGVNTVNFTDVAGRIDATSVSFTSLTDPDGTIVLEQNYVYDLVNASALLNRYVDEDISVTVEDGTLFNGTLLSGRGGEIILTDESGSVIFISLEDVRDIRFPSLPEGLITRPTLRWLVQSEQGGEQQVELTYLTGGLNWTADYIINLARDNNNLDLNGWVTLGNNSGTAYTDAQLKLIAGDVNRLPEQEVMMEMAMDVQPTPMAAGGRGVAQRQFSEYQLYEVNRRVTIANNETKQIEFVTGAGIPANTFFVYDSTPPAFGYSRGIIQDQFYGQTGVTDVQNWLEFTTDEASGLGADLPAGRVRVYQDDIDGAALLIGESSIDHTPQGEEVRLFLGNAFDLVGERTQLDFRIVTQSVITEAWEIRLRNRKDDETVQIRVPERLFRWSNWEILSTTHEYEQLDSSTIEFRVDVPPGGETVIAYTVQYSWPR